mgnify:CR=1 FL=1
MMYLTNAFALNMLNKFPANVTVEKLDYGEFCAKLTSTDYVNAIGHSATADLLSTLCSITVTTNRIAVKVNPGDTLLVVTLLQRLDEGKVLSDREILDMLNNNKIGFFFVKVS